MKMSQLTELYSSLGLENVRTYIQSGNVVFSDGSKDASSIGTKIEMALKQRLGLDVTVFVRTHDELRKIVAKNPFLEKDLSKLHVTFLRTKLLNFPMDKLIALRDRHEEFAIKDREIYLFLPNGMGKSKLSNNCLEKAFGISATTRNWNTVTTLLEMAGEAFK